MTGKSPWQELEVPLRELATVFGCVLKESPPKEEPDKVRYYFKVPVDKAEQAFPKDEPGKTQKRNRLNEVFEALRDKYPHSIEFKIISAEWEVLSLDTYKPADLEDLYDRVLKREQLLLDLTIDKKELLEQLKFVDAPQANIKLYFSPSALVQALSVPPSKLEGENRSLLKEFTGEEKFIILVPDNDDFALNGNYLTVLGGQAVADWQTFLPTQDSRQARLNLDYIREQFNKNPRSTDINPRYLTPLQLFLDWPRQKQDAAAAGSAPVAPPPENPIARVLFAQLIAYSLLFLASNSKVKGNRDEGFADDYPWIFTFAEDKYLIRIEVNSIEEIGAALVFQGGAVPWQSAQTIGSLVSWAYSEERALDNRLILLQVVIASSLQDNNPINNLLELIRRAPDLHERIHRRWNAFMEEKLEKFFGQIKELEQTVDTTTKSYNEQIDALTKTLTENMLAAVGVLVGTFIAAIFTSPFKPLIFLVGAGTYLAYLIIFPMRVGLTSAHQRFESSHKAFRSRRDDFIKRLSQEEVSDIVKGSVRSAERRYIYWFRTTKRLYQLVVMTFVLILIVAAGLAFGQQFSARRNSLAVGGVFYHQAATSEVVPLLIQGNNFDKDKEIVITIGDSSFTNADGSVKLLGSTMLTFSPRQEDLMKARESSNGFFFVKQGVAEPLKATLPSAPAPIPQPAFDKWIRLANSGGEIVEANGFNFDSISTIESGGAKLDFKVLDHGRTLRLTDYDRLAQLQSGQALQVRLKNGDRREEAIPPAQLPR